MPANDTTQGRDRDASPQTTQAGGASTSTRSSETARTAQQKRSDQEQSIQTGRENSRSTGISRRGQTSPVYGPGTAGFTPFTLMRRMAEDMDRLFENFGFGPSVGLAPAFGLGSSRDLWSGQSGVDRNLWSPQVETFRRGDKLVVRADLPGLKKEDVKVEIENGVLSISGERSEHNEETRDDFYRSERSYGQFYRAVQLPEGVGENQCEATFADGVLEVTVPAPKETERKARQIQIR